MSQSSQLNLFLPIVGEASTKDQQDLMSYPCFSLSKRKRTKIIEFKSKESWIKVYPDTEFGMAQIWDADILIYCASLIKYMQKNELELKFPLRIRGNDLLNFTDRGTSERSYTRLREALDRLKGTTVRTNIRLQDGLGKYHAFNWISEWKEEYRMITDKKTGKEKKISDGFEIDLPKWFVESVLDDRLVLTITDEYFKIKGGIQRYLYRLCRKHCGKQKEWRISLKGLHKRSASNSSYREFKRMMKKAVEDGIPQYDLLLAEVDSVEMLLVYPSKYALDYEPEKVLAYSKPK